MQVCKRQLAGETVCTAGGVIIIVIMILVTLMITTIIMITMTHIYNDQYDNEDRYGNHRKLQVKPGHKPHKRCLCML